MKRLLAALILCATSAQAATSGLPSLTRSRSAQFTVVKTYADGPWVVPTVDALRSAADWDRAMDRWEAAAQVAGREPAPAIDWSHDALVVVALGSQVGRCGVSVEGCTVDGDVTRLDLHFDLGGSQPDPNGETVHPAVLVAVRRSDLKKLEVAGDAVIEGLPTGAAGNAGLPVSALDLLADGPVAATWGRVKANYR